MHKISSWIALLTAAALLLPITPAFAKAGMVKISQEEKMVWDNVQIGPGGFTTGLVIHPTVPGIMYARTDVGGAYRLNPDVESETGVGKWEPITDGFSLDEYNLYGIDGIALDPGNPDVVYIAAGLDIGKSPSDVLKSTDRGQTWVRTHLDQKFYGNSGGSNGDQRVDGECIAVDPHNSNIVLCGTRKAGLYCSMDGAQTWSKVAAVPNAADPDGIRTVIFDPDSGITNDGRTKVAYVGVNGQGIYTTTDGEVHGSICPQAPCSQSEWQYQAVYCTSPVESLAKW